MNALPLPAIAEDIWDMKYRLKDNQTGQPLDADIHATWARVAAALASAEPEHEPRPKHRAAFMRALADYRFLPAGRIIAGAGAGRNVTLFNCYVMGAIEDDMTSIFEHLKEAARFCQVTQLSTTMSGMKQELSYRGYRFPPDIISRAVWLYHRFARAPILWRLPGRSRRSLSMSGIQTDH